MRSNSREIEASLIICSENAETVAAQIGSLKSIDGYELLPGYTEAIHDIYFDTPEDMLESRKLALRIREKGSRRWVALKGASRPADEEGIADRLEIEAEWSDEALTTILRELDTRGITIQQRWEQGALRPMEAVRSLGFRIIQDRETQRTVRNVIRGKKRDSVLAELAIDSVVYHFGGQDVRHHELEIEAKGTDGFAITKALLGILDARYAPALRRWNHSKLATGQALEKMLDEGVLKGLLDRNNNLKPAVYDSIDDYIKHRAI